MLSQRCLKEGFAEALEHSLGEQKMQILDYDYSTRAFSAPISSPLLLRLKKGEMDF